MSKTTQRVLALAVVVIAGPLIEAAAIRQTWNWFLYNWRGLPFGQWYGLAVISHIVLWRLHQARGDGGGPRLPEASVIMERAIWAWGGMWVCALVTWIVGAVFGWVPAL